ncbi:MAG: phospho-N-acetylmuramoyl-pentapeptide-transferase [Oscillospiraceae bacterium]|jgi:phospho-N-acetylmuramoyl-pentapeptide-transferase|nr:phospho-N-acetylmuramoyl-pentapeptide-transferase [Oscillospiraceae bacterium]
MKENFSGYAALLLACGAAMGLTAALGYAFIPWLHKLKFGQTILDIGPSWHKHKQGIPTMGGVMFIIGIPLALVITFATNALRGGNLFTAQAGAHRLYYPDLPGGGYTTKLVAGLLMALLFALMGFLDDYTKVVKKQNKGLSVSQKSLMQIVISFGYLVTLLLSMQGKPYTLVPFLGVVTMPSWLFLIFGFAVLYCATNAVNFTDGVDGLCSSVTVTAAAALAVIAVMRGMFGAGAMAAALAGGCAGFLVWNRNPAKVIMGDTGSMFLGGLLVAICFALDCPVILLLVGLIYVIEGLSDVLQIGYFKMTHGKRIFKMAPIHHHYEMSGWSEKKIVAVFTLVNALGAATGVAAVWFGLKLFVVS